MAIFQLSFHFRTSFSSAPGTVAERIVANQRTLPSAERWEPLSTFTAQSSKINFDQLVFLAQPFNRMHVILAPSRSTVDVDMAEQPHETFGWIESEGLRTFRQAQQLCVA